MSSTHGNVCRFCMRTETTLISLFDGNNDIPKKLQASINILVGEEDDLPNNVCEECAEKVNVCYNFKMLCEHSIAAFKRYLQLFPSNQQQPTSTSPWSEDMHSSDVAELCTTDMTSSGDKITEFKISSAENNTSFSELSAEESTRKEVEKWKCSPSEDSNTFPETTMEIYIKEEKPEIEEFLPEEEKPEIEEFLPEINVSDDYIMSKNKTENITDTSLEQGDAAGRITGKSRKQYDFSYNRFMEWCSKNNVQTINVPTRHRKREGAKQRGQWSDSDLQEAVRRIKAGEISIREAERCYHVPERTIRRRMGTGNMGKPSRGPEGVLGTENEKRLVAHIQRLCSAGFAPDKRTVRSLAYQFAEKLNLNHRFSHEEKMAGPDWLASFLRRNGELSEGLLAARALGMNREAVRHFFDLLEEVMNKHDFHTNPGNIANVDESAIQLINKTGKVLAMKGSKAVHKVTSSEKCETVTLMACNFADGRFMPPVIILKGKNKKPEYEDGLPPGSEVLMNPKSSYINVDIFLKWFKGHYLPHRKPGTNLLILDEHVSHTNSLEFLELAEQNNVILLCLPPHALQPLDHTFFGPLKTYFQELTNRWIRCHPNRNITRYQMGPLIGQAWQKAASVGNAINGFRSTGIFPFNPDADPEHFFSIADEVTGMTDSSSETLPGTPANLPKLSISPILNSSKNLTETPTDLPKHPTSTTPEKVSPFTSKETPSKHLHTISPVPVLEIGNQRRRSAEILSSQENMTRRTVMKDRKRGTATQRGEKEGVGKKSRLET